MKLSIDLREKILLSLFFALISAILLAPIGSHTAIPMVLDYLNHLNGIMQAKASLAAGQFPLRVMGNAYNGWDYPYYQFYSPTSYLLASTIYHWVAPSNPFVAYKMTIWLAYIIGGIYLYRLSNWFVKSKPAALLAGAVYLTAPYNIILINQLAAFNEAIATGLMPAVMFYTLQRYYDANGVKALIQAAFMWYLLITIHLLTFLSASFFIGLMLILITIRHPTQWYRLIRVGIAYLLACLLAMWFLAPIALLSKYFVIDQSFASVATFNSYQPFFANLISPVANLPFTPHDVQSTVMDVVAHCYPSFGLFSMVGFTLCLYMLCNKQKLAYRRVNYWLLILVLLFAVNFFLVWSPINFWRVLPASFRVVQYSWRLLGQSIWIGALLFSFGLVWLFNNKLDERHVAIAILLIVTASSAWFPQYESHYSEFNGFLKNPTIASQATNYLIDPQKYLSHVNVIDSIALNPSPDSAYKISPQILNVMKNPEIIVKNNLAKKTNSEHAQLTAYLNDVVVATHTLTSGSFDWHLGLARNISSPLALRLKWNDESLQKATTQTVILSGFLDKKTVMSVPEVQKNCSHQKEKTICNITVPSGIKLIELPQFFYPELWQITINDKPVSYQSVLYQGQLITGVTPQAGEVNSIHIYFSGLVWANEISWMAWLLLGLLSIYGIKLHFDNRVHQRYARKAQ